MSTKNQKRNSRTKPVVRRASRKGSFDEVNDEAILGYQRYRVGAALPWDHAPHAVRAVWAKLSNDIGPRESGRGIRSGM